MADSVSCFGKTRPALVLLLLSVTSAVRAQDYHVRHYTIDDGLPSSQIRDVTQDAQGRMWFATRSGIASYDGSEWSIYNLAHGLDWADTFALRWDEAGILWAASSASPSRVSYLDRGLWKPFPPPDGFPEGARITAFAVAGHDRGRTVAVGTDHGLFLNQDDHWRLVSLPDGLPSQEVTALAVADSRIVIGTAQGLAELEGDRISTRFGRVMPDSGSILALAVEHMTEGGSRLWVVASGGTGYLESGRFTLAWPGSPRPPPPSPAARYLAVADRRGGLYVGNQDACFHFDSGEGPRPIGPDNGLLSQGVSALFLDREDVLWVGSRHGVSKIPNRRFATFNLRHGLLADEVTAVLEKPDGTIVLAHPSGLSFVDGTDVRTLDLLRLLPEVARHNDRIRDLALDARGDLWVPTFGLVRVEPSGQVSWYGERQGLRGAVSSVLASRGRLWAAGDEGLFSWNGTRFEPASADAPRLAIRRIFEGADGAVLVGAVTGVYRFSDDDGWSRWTCQEGPACNSTFAIHERGEGGLWVGTSAGLYRTSGRNLVRETTPEIGHPVYFVLRDTLGRSWFGIDNGVLRWDGETLEHFTVHDGLAGRETNRAAGRVDSRGRVWIGTERGVTVYTEDLRKPPRAPPYVMLIDVEASGRRFPLLTSRRLAYEDNDLTFHFRAISFVDEDRVRVGYQLEGHDLEWIAPRTMPRQELRYTNLSPGVYRLHVRAISAEGVESRIVSSARIAVASPFWRQPWFFLAVGVLAAAALYFVQSLVAQKRYSRRLEAVVEQRLAQLRKAEEELAQNQKLEAIGLLAGGIAHDFNNFLTVLMGNVSLLAMPGRSEEQRADDLRDAQAAIVRASKLTHQLLTFSSGGAPARTAASIAEVIEESASFVLSGSKVRCQIDLPEDLRVVEIDSGQIHQLMNNLLINAMQAMPDGGTIRIVGRNVDATPPGLDTVPEGRHSAHFVAIDVVDEGVGIPREDLSRIFDPYFTTKKEGRGMGLASSYSIARRHDGLLTVESEPGKGSRFTLFLPASEAPLPEAESEDEKPQDGHGRILVMDDEESIRRVTCAIVEGLGYESAPAADGAEAIALYRQAMSQGRPFSVVIMDLTIPGGMGGQEAIRQLREIDPDVKAIVVSGYSNDPVMASYRDFGFQARLSKPFRTGDLAQALLQVTRQSDAIGQTTV